MIDELGRRLYARLTPLLGDDDDAGDVDPNRRQQLLEACIRALERLAGGRQRAEDAASSLFAEIRSLFDPERLLQVRLIVDLDIPSAAATLDSPRSHPGHRPPGQAEPSPS